MWNSIIRKRYQLSDSNQILINYKLLKRNVRLKLKKELKEYEWKVATNFKLHPKMLYKNIIDKVKVTSVIRAITNLHNEVVTDPKIICEQFNE